MTLWLRGTRLWTLIASTLPDLSAAAFSFKIPRTQIVVGFDHANYGHIARLPEPVRTALADDFD